MRRLCLLRLSIRLLRLRIGALLPLNRLCIIRRLRIGILLLLNRLRIIIHRLRKRALLSLRRLRILALLSLSRLTCLIHLLPLISGGLIVAVLIILLSLRLRLIRILILFHMYINSFPNFPIMTMHYILLYHYIIISRKNQPKTLFFADFPSLRTK